MDEKKFKVINDAITNIEKQFGKGTIMQLGDKPLAKVDVISTGCLSLDIACGVGGVPRGRIIEIYGPEASGKTTLTLHIIAEAQKAGGAVAFVDAENALDLAYSKNLGVDIKSMYLSQPDYGEQALEIVDTLVRSGGFDVIVIDSVAALTPRAEIEGDMGDHHMAVQARLMSQALRKLTSAISRSKTIVIFTNQLRSKIGIMFGNPETTSGGNALKFYASMRFDIRRISAVKAGKDKKDITGNRTKIKIVKNKLAPPFKEVEVTIRFGQGIDYIEDLVDLAIGFNIINKSGAWYTYGEDRYQGKESLMEGLKSIPTIIENLKLNILQEMEGKSIISNTEIINNVVDADNAEIINTDDELPE